VSSRVSPTDQLRAEIDDLFGESSEQRQLGDTLEEVARLGARLLLQTALEAEVTEFLCRNRYERRRLAKDPRAGSRNGYGNLTVKTTAGPVTLKRPKLRGTTEQFASRLLGKGVTRTNALESLVIAGFIRGLSVRDVEATLAEALGPEATVSKSTVSRVCQAIKDEFAAFKARSLADVELEYMFLDGSHFKYHQGAKAEPVLVAWGITTTGKPVLLHLAPGSSESTDAWSGFLEDMIGRGLRPPLLVVSDGAPGLISACELVLSTSLRQRCLIHRARNILARVPSHAQGEVKSEFWRIFNDIEAAPGSAAVAEARRPGEALFDQVATALPSRGRMLRGRLRSPRHIPALPGRALAAHPPQQFHRAHLRRDAPEGESDRPAPRRAELPLARVGGARPRLEGMAWGGDDTGNRAPAAEPAA